MDALIKKCLRSYLLDSEHPVYVVGGVLRNQHLGILSYDFDFAANKAEKTAERFAKQIGATFVPLDNTPRRETYRVVNSTGTKFDFSELQGNSIEDDLACRDFTINAMAQPLKDFLNGTKRILDPFNGRKDLELKIIRSLPGRVLEDDPLRVLRAFRFAAVLNFRIDTQTFQLIEKVVPRLSEIAEERIYQECRLFYESQNTEHLIFQMNQIGIWNQIFPERTIFKDILTPDGKTTILNESLAVYRRLEFFLNQPQKLFPDRFDDIASHLKSKHLVLLKLASLLYPLKDQEKLMGMLTRLRFSKSELNLINCIVKGLYRALDSKLYFAGWKVDFSEIYQFISEAGSQLIPIIILTSAFWVERNGIKSTEEDPFIRSVHNIIDFYLYRYLPAKKMPPFITGDDLIAKFKMKPSPLFKTILGYIEEGRVLGSISSREQAETMVLGFIENL